MLKLDLNEINRLLWRGDFDGHLNNNRSTKVSYVVGVPLTFAYEKLLQCNKSTAT